MKNSFVSAKNNTEEKKSISPLFYTPDRNNISVFILVSVLVPLYVLAAGRYGQKVFVVLILTCLAGYLTESSGAFITHKPRTYPGISSWIIYPLLTPPGMPVWMILLAFIIALILTQILFGGFGRHLFHPAVAGQIILMINFSGIYNKSYLKPFNDVFFGLTEYSSQSLAEKSTQVILESGINISNTELLTGPNTGLISEVFPLGIIIFGLIYLLAGETNIRTPLSFLLSFFLFSILGNRIKPDTVLTVLPGMLSGGILFYSFFIFSDRWSSARTNGGRVISGIVAAFLTILIRSGSSNAEGVMFAAVFNYSFSPLYDEFVMSLQKRKRQRL